MHPKIKNKKITIRISYSETDQMGVVYYSNHFVWFERARTEFFREIGFPYTDLEKKEIYLPVVEAFCHYFTFARYDDELDVYTHIKEFKIASISFEYEVKRGKDLIATGYTKHAFVNKKNKTIKIPEYIRNSII